MRTPTLLLAMTVSSQMILAEGDVSQSGLVEVNGESGRHEPSNKEAISAEDISRHNRK